MTYETEELSEKIWNELPGKIIQLSQGKTYYELKGPETGELVIFIHGFSIPSFCWDPTFEYLLAEGFRVLRYDLYGRGYSERPRVKYSPELYDTQLYELVHALHLDSQQINLVALSMGGVIAVNFADHHPELVKRISFEDPAGFSNANPGFPGIIKIPILGKIIFQKIGIPRLVERLPINFYQGTQNPKMARYRDLYCIQLKYKGYAHAIFSTMQNMPMNQSDDVYHRVANNIPIQLFWGEFDEVLPEPPSELVNSLLGNTNIEIIRNAGHTCNYEQPEQYNPLLLQFLKS